MLESKLPRHFWPRLGICGSEYGLGNRWYLCIKKENQEEPGLMAMSPQNCISQEAQNIRKNSTASANKDNKENGNTAAKERSIQGWKILRRATIDQLLGNADQEVYFI